VWGLVADGLERRQRREEERYSWQVPPDPIPTQGMWLLEGGRGIGKTQAIAAYADQHVHGPPCDPFARGGHRLAIVAPTLGDAAESVCAGPSGIMRYSPTARLVTELGGAKLVWPNGAEAKLFSGRTKLEVDRLRAGGNRCLVLIEEAAAIPHLSTALAHAKFGLRTGPRPHLVAASTPRPRPDYIEMRNRAIITHGRTQDAHRLGKDVIAALYGEYGGTSLGRQELDGALLDTAQGALWRLDQLDADRRDGPPDLSRVVLGVDPAVTSGPGSDETGIIVAGIDQPWPSGGHGWVLADKSGRYSPARAWEIACLTASEYAVDAIVYEVNQGGDYVTKAAKDAWAALDREGRVEGPLPRLIPVRAKAGKRLRAEPIAAQYEQRRWHHTGMLARLEDQLCQWEPGKKWRNVGPPGSDEVQVDSPDRLDALVYCAIELTGAAAATVVSFPILSAPVASASPYEWQGLRNVQY
jgi:phage terminase large subunit-like protein